MELTKTLSHEMIEELASKIRGTITTPDDAGYDDVRKIYNAMIDKHPAIIVKCTDSADVQHALSFGKQLELPIAVRGGGHNGGGLGICNDGLVIDLSGIKYVRVNTADNTVRVGGGNLWGEVDHATQAFGLAVPAGIISTTGVGGLTLGGGVGYLSRKYGLTIDNLLEVDMVLADGTCVTANKDQYEDLFWAVRGGGGNFGIVTSFKFQAHPLSTVCGGPMLWPIEDTERIMAWFDKFIDDAHEDLNGFIATMSIPGDPFPPALHGKMFCGIVWCYLRDEKNLDEMLAPARALNPIFEHVGPMPYPAIQSMFDGMMVPGMQWYWRADFFNEIQPEAAAQHRKFGASIPTPLSQMHLYPINGAGSKPSSTDTPWAYRDAKYAGVIVGVDPSPEHAGILTEWCKDYYDALHPYSAGGAYSNFMMEEGQERVMASYRQNYDRLTEIKAKYDPDNVFRLNQNIKPKA